MELIHRREVEEKTFEKSTLEAKTSELDGVLKQLNHANKACSELTKQSSQLKDQAKKLADQYGLITSRMREVLRALDYIQHDNNVENWDCLRFLALQSLSAMMEALRAGDVLEDQNYALLERLTAIDFPVEQSLDKLEY